MGTGGEEDVALTPESNGAASPASVKIKEMETMLEPSSPPKEPMIIYYIFYLLGMGTLLPWNFFITANSYWEYKFRNATVPIGADGKMAATELQYNFFAYLAVASMVPNTIFLTLNAIFAHLIRQQLKLVLSLAVVIVFFVATTILVPIKSDDWQTSFFGLTMAIVVCINIGAAIFQGGLFGLSAQFPPKYLTAVLSGQALGAVFACLARIISIAVSGDDAVAAAVNSALVYFTLAVGTLVLSMCAYLWMTKTPFYKYYTGLHGPDRAKGNEEDVSRASSAISRTEDSVSVWQVFLKVKWYALSVTLVFLVTLALFPAITAKVRVVGSEDDPSIWARDYYVPVFCFLWFNLGDYAGRTAGGYKVWPKPGAWQWVLLLVLARVAFFPLLMYCNIDHKHLHTVFNSDIYYVAFMALFAISNGYLATLCMIYGPGMVEPSERNTASSLMAAFLGLGLCLGAALSNGTIKII